MLAGVVLAGGKSTRMGQDKSQLTLTDNKTNLLTLSQNLLANLAGENVWVSGEKHHNGLPDEFADCGPLSGIYSALAYFKQEQPSIDEVIFLPVDMPFLRVGDLELLCERGRRVQSLCSYQDHIFPLYVSLSSSFSADFFKYMHQQLSKVQVVNTAGKTSNLSIRKVLAKFDSIQIKAMDPTYLVNINTQQEWQQHKTNIKI